MSPSLLGSVRKLGGACMKDKREIACMATLPRLGYTITHEVVKRDPTLHKQLYTQTLHADIILPHKHCMSTRGVCSAYIIK